MTTHTPKREGDLPWTYAKSGSVNGNDNCYQIHWSEDGECVAEVVHGEKAAALIVHRVNGWDEQQAKIDELASLLDKALEDVSKVDRWGEPHQPTIDFVNRCLELITLTRAKGV